MITAELLAQSEALNGLSAEQKQAIVELSKRDEDMVIGERIGKVYGDLDADILATSGMEKNGTEKTYVYAKRVIGELKSKAESAQELQTQVEALTKAKSELEEAIAKGSADSETKKQLTQAKADLADITQKYTELVKRGEEIEAKHAREIFDMRIGMEIDAAAKAIKFKASIPESASRVVLSSVIDKIKATADYVEADGKQTLVFKGENGEVLRDASLKPLTATDMLTKELEAMGVLDNRRVVKGAGSKADTSEGANAIDLSGVKTQEEAENVIHKSLVARGLTRGSKDYQDAMTEAWKANSVNKLPQK